MRTPTRLERLERLELAMPVTVDYDNLDMSDAHIVAVWRALRLVGVAEQFLPDGMTLDDLDEFIDFHESDYSLDDDYGQEP